MNDQQQPNEIDLLIGRLSNRIGQLTAENEWLMVQLGTARAQLQEMQQRVDPMMSNGERQSVEEPAV